MRYIIDQSWTTICSTLIRCSIKIFSVKLSLWSQIQFHYKKGAFSSWGHMTTMNCFSATHYRCDWITATVFNAKTTLSYIYWGLMMIPTFLHFVFWSFHLSSLKTFVRFFQAEDIKDSLFTYGQTHWALVTSWCHHAFGGFQFVWCLTMFCLCLQRQKHVNTWTETNCCWCFTDYM